jgi:hypothetical protein
VLLEPLGEFVHLLQIRDLLAQDDELVRAHSGANDPKRPDQTVRG